MGRRWKIEALMAAALLAWPAARLASQAAQSGCARGTRIEGAITDPTGAMIAGAQVQAADGERTVTDVAGRFTFACVAGGSYEVTAMADGFAPATASAEKVAGGVARISLRLTIAKVETSVQVRGEDATAMDEDRGSDTAVLGAAQVQQLADDPDDFLRQLQALAAAAGGDPASATISVDGFKNGSAMPPKGSIASIRINPDLFSTEYQWAPWGGGVIEIVTKPGADAFHGALFLTDSNSIFNATDPFSTTATPAGKQRYGVELSGPIVAGKSGFSMALEKRDIDEFNVVNAVALNANLSQAPVHDTVAAPQRLWIGSARGDWQATAKDVAALSYSANVNSLGNQGVGGLVLPEAGYSGAVSEYDLRLNNTLTLNANLLHETRVGYSWKRTAQTPLSTAPGLQVAGYFVGGGASSQNLSDRERDLEIDDDAMLTRGRHTLKLGVQSVGAFVHDYDPNTFNGAYVFGGGSAPVLDAGNQPTGETTIISAIEQYRRALLGLAGGTPTTYQLTGGTPLVALVQWQMGWFAQDVVKLTPRLTLNAGLRYQLQSLPGSYANVTPRLGFAWSPDKKQTWVFHIRAGLFRRPTDLDDVTEVYRLNGSRQRETTIYSPSYSHPLTPVAGSIAVSAMDRFPKSPAQVSTFITYFNAEHEFAQHWHARVNLFWGEDYDNIRIRNVNAPMVAGSVGAAPDPTQALLAPRPIARNENIFEYQNSGHLAGNVVSFNLDQHDYKWMGLDFRWGHENFKSDVLDAATGLNSPQSSYTDRGESARVEWMKDNYFTFTGNLIFPRKFEIAAEFDGGDGTPYNVTTGTDNNGDGDFNDRPSYASAPGPGVYSTRFGYLTTNTVNGDVPRNLGTMPGPIHLDVNLSRAFSLNPKDKDRPQTVAVNARSANLLNHTNVTAVSSVVSSPTFSQPIAAEPARRVELGIRYSF
jgi:hypothetical protein